MEFRERPLQDDVVLKLNLFDPLTGQPVTGQSPTLTIRRYRNPHVAGAGGALDEYFWNDVSEAFQSGLYSINMVEFDATNNPGLYVHLFEQSKIQVETIYLIRYDLAAGPLAGRYDEEMLTITSATYIAEDVDTKLTAEHGEGQWALGSQGTPFDPDGVLP